MVFVSPELRRARQSQILENMIEFMMTVVFPGQSLMNFCCNSNNKTVGNISRLISGEKLIGALFSLLLFSHNVSSMSSQFVSVCVRIFGDLCVCVFGELCVSDH